MRIKSGCLTSLGALLGTQFLRAWMRSLEYKAVYYDLAADPASPECRGQKIYVLWHEYILFPLFFRAHCRTAILLSRHPDADVLAHVARHMGFQSVRGSTNRGGVAAIRDLMRRCRHMHLTITPDGPRGPRRQMTTGPIYLASKLGIPLVPMGFGYDRPWRVRRAWDQFAVPRPYSRARAVLGPEVLVPPDLSREGLEHFRQRFEHLQNRLTEEAEVWAALGTRKAGQLTPTPGPVQPRPRRVDPAHHRPAPVRHLFSGLSFRAHHEAGRSDGRAESGQAETICHDA